MNYGKNWWSSRKRDREQGDLFDDDPYEKPKSREYSNWGNQYAPKTGYGYYTHSFYKKPDIINPTLHWVDEDRIKVNIKKSIDDGVSISAILNIIANTPMDDLVLRKKILSILCGNTGNLITKIHKEYGKIPEHIKNDIFKMYYHSTVKLDYAERVDSNKADYEYIDAAMNPVAKVMTEANNLKSLIFTKDIMIYFAILKALEDILENSNNSNNDSDDDQDDENNKDDKNNSGDGGAKAGQKFNLANDFEKNVLENVIQQTKKVCANLDNVISKEMQDLLYQGTLPIENLSISNISSDVLKEIEKSLSNLEMNTKSLKEKLNKLLDRSTSNFSSKKKTEFKDIFSAEDFSMLDEYEMLHPKLRKIMMEDIMIPEHKYMGKLDVYVDVSGSMGSHSGVTLNGKTAKDRKNVSKCDLAKMIVYSLYKMGILNNFYAFENDVRQLDASPIAIASLTPRGGTSLNIVVKNIEKEKQNAIIITDAEDSCTIYSTNAFFLGVKGSNFHYFSDTALKQYSQKSQIIVYDGDQIFDVNESGDLI